MKKIIIAAILTALAVAGAIYLFKPQNPPVMELGIPGQVIQPVSPNPSFRPSPRPQSGCQPACLGRFCLQLPCRENQ